MMLQFQCHPNHGPHHGQFERMRYRQWFHFTRGTIIMTLQSSQHYIMLTYHLYAIKLKLCVIV